MDVVEERPHLLNHLTKHIHLASVDKERGLDEDASTAFGTQLQQGIERQVLLHTTLSHPFRHMLRREAVLYLHVGESQPYLLVKSFDRASTSVIVGSTEMSHQYRVVLLCMSH